MLIGKQICLIEKKSYVWFVSISLKSYSSLPSVDFVKFNTLTPSERKALDEITKIVALSIKTNKNLIIFGLFCSISPIKLNYFLVPKNYIRFSKLTSVLQLSERIYYIRSVNLMMVLMIIMKWCKIYKIVNNVFPMNKNTKILYTNYGYR